MRNSGCTKDFSIYSHNAAVFYGGLAIGLGASSRNVVRSLRSLEVALSGHGVAPGDKRKHPVCACAGYNNASVVNDVRRRHGHVPAVATARRPLSDTGAS